MLFAIGLIGASALAAAVVPLSTSYAVGETIGVERSVGSGSRRRRCSSACSPRRSCSAPLIAMTPVNVISVLIGSQVLQGLISPVILVFILVLANRRSLIGAAANSRRYRVAAGIVVTGIGAMSILLLGDTVIGWV